MVIGNAIAPNGSPMYRPYNARALLIPRLTHGVSVCSSIYSNKGVRKTPTPRSVMRLSIKFANPVRLNSPRFCPMPSELRKVLSAAASLVM